MLTIPNIIPKKLNKALIILRLEKKRYFKSGIVCLAHQKWASFFSSWQKTIFVFEEGVSLHAIHYFKCDAQCA